jgi:hypothetical protein
MNIFSLAAENRGLSPFCCFFKKDRNPALPKGFTFLQRLSRGKMAEFKT